MTEGSMARYEVLFLVPSELSHDDAAMIESQFHSLISQQKGEVLSYERWGKYRLAYRVNGEEYGIYYLSRFELPVAQLREALEALRIFFAVKHRELVMRYVFSSLPKDAPLTYTRPESLEEAPTRERSQESGAGEEMREAAVAEEALVAEPGDMSEELEG